MQPNRSLQLTIFITRFFIVFWFLCLLFGYFLVKAYVHYHGILFAFEAMVITLYICLAYAVFILYHLHQLLHNIQEGMIFHDDNCFHLRYLSLLCLGIGFTTMIAAYWYIPFLLIGIIFCFIALMIRVIKHIMHSGMFCEAVS